MDNGELLLWVLGGVVGVITVLAGAVRLLDQRSTASQERLLKNHEQQLAAQGATIVELKTDVTRLVQRADECEEDRDNLRTKVAVLEDRQDRTDRKLPPGHDTINRSV